MRTYKLMVLTMVVVGLTTPNYANVCDMWGTARARPVEKQFNLKELAEYIKSDQSATIRNCYGTDLLKTNVTMSPFELDPHSGTMIIASTQNGNSSQHKVSVGENTYELKTNGSTSQVRGTDNKWHDVTANLKGMMPLIERMRQPGGLNPITARDTKIYSDEKLAPMADAVLLTGVAGIGSSFSLLFTLQYAALAEEEGLRENIGGWDTSVWRINNEKAEAYAASRGRPIDTSGSYIRYWVTKTGLVIKVDAHFTPKLMGVDKTTIFKYKVSKTVE